MLRKEKINLLNKFKKEYLPNLKLKLTNESLLFDITSHFEYFLENGKIKIDGNKINGYSKNKNFFELIYTTDNITLKYISNEGRKNDNILVDFIDNKIIILENRIETTRSYDSSEIVLTEKTILKKVYIDGKLVFNDDIKMKITTIPNRSSSTRKVEYIKDNIAIKKIINIGEKDSFDAFNDVRYLKSDNYDTQYFDSSAKIPKVSIIGYYNITEEEYNKNKEIMLDKDKQKCK